MSRKTLAAAAIVGLGSLIASVLTGSPAQAFPSCGTVTTVGSATVVTFTTPGTCTWVVPDGVTVLSQVLVVGGGGAGGRDVGGGGDAGGVVQLTNQTVTPGESLTVVVGAGGASKTTYPYSAASDGQPSSILGYTALGGGQGGSGSEPGANGGSGGGAGYSQGPEEVGGSATQPAPGLGFGGGNAASSSAGGGGGAGGAGVSAPVGGVPDQGGNGGAGIASRISGTLRYYAGGGGGGSGRVGTPTSGGSGVGGSGLRADNGSGTVFATDGAANTGSGGGGGTKVSNDSGAGGSGVVIVRIGGAADPVPAEAPAATWSLGLNADGGVCSESATVGAEGTWQQLPKATACSKAGVTLLGWATSPAFPVGRAKEQVAKGWGAIDEVIEGVRMIFIPAGGYTFITGENSLYAIWG